MQPECAVPIGTFIDEKDDTELLDILPILHEMRTVDDVREVLGLRVAQLHAKQRSSAQQKARFRATIRVVASRSAGKATVQQDAQCPTEPAGMQFRAVGKLHCKT